MGCVAGAVPVFTWEICFGCLPAVDLAEAVSGIVHIFYTLNSRPSSSSIRCFHV